MFWKRIIPLLALAVFYLSACGVPPTATIPPSPKPVVVSYSPYLAGIQEALHACAVELPQLAIFFEEIPSNQQDFSGTDLVIWWGEVPDASKFAYPLNTDALQVIVNPENPKKEFSRSELISLFSGRIVNWTEIGTLDQKVEVWIFPEKNLISETFQAGVLGGERFTRLATIAPTAEAMLESIASQPGAIGFLPQSWLSADVQAVQIPEAQQLSVRKPLLALVQAEPQGDLAALVACLQNGPGQDKLANYYQVSE
jgi:hypothetical protein